MKHDIYDAFMLDHAIGALCGGLSVAADLHIKLSDDGVERSLLWDIVGGALIERDSSSLGSRSVKPRRRKTKPAMTADAILNVDLSDLNWKNSLSGADMAHAGLRESHFMRLEPGKNVPAHSHSAIEATVVLEGALEVDGEVFQKGDIAFGAPGEIHKPAAHGDDACVCFVAWGERPFWRLT
ncbi:MAG: cupin domain-containing protein [Pseudomonadota bacterium]